MYKKREVSMKRRNYTRMFFGRKENRIDVTLLSRPIEMGLAGMIKGETV